MVGASLWACSGDSPFMPYGISAFSIVPETVTIRPGETVQLKIQGWSADKATVTWTSTPEYVASVDAKGRVVGRGAGRAWIKATTHQFSDSAVVEVQRADGQAFLPNEPPGFQRIAEHDFSCLPGEGCALAGHWSHQTHQDQNMSIVDDSDAAQSSRKVLRGRFPPTTLAGTGAFRFDGWGPEQGVHNEYKELYITFWMKIEGRNFENEATGTKILYVGYANTERGNHSILSLRGNGRSGALMDRMHLHYWISEMKPDGSDPGGSRLRDQNINATVQFESGKWHQVELLLKINDIGQANGEATWWLDGIRLAHHTGIRYRSAQNPKAFYRMHFTSIWGGTIGQKTREDFWRFDHVYLSAR